jgi:hypothetical protein
LFGGEAVLSLQPNVTGPAPRFAYANAGFAGFVMLDPLRFLSFDPSEPGIIAIGQYAVGVIAFGQVATGVIAVGQAARGVIAIGQVGAGVFAIGQGALGIIYAGGLQFSVAARAHCLFHWEGLSLAPPLEKKSYPEPPKPELRQLAAILGKREPGWIEVRLADGKAFEKDQELDLRFDDSLQKQFERTPKKHNRAYLHIRADGEFSGGGYREGAEFEPHADVTEIVSFQRRKPHWGIEEGELPSVLGIIVRSLFLAGLCVAYWFGVAMPLFKALL